MNIEAPFNPLGFFYLFNYNFLMKILTLFLVLTSVMLISSCSTTSSYIPVQNLNSRGNDCKLDIFMPGQTPKVETDVIGNFSVKEMGLSVACDWEDTLAKNKQHACEKGADGIQFLSVSAPSIRSTCYQSKANFFIYKK